MENNKAKVFGIGLNKTGTTTLGVCLNKLGYNVKDCDLKLLKYSDQKKMDPIYDTVKKYDGFQDWPWPLLYKELDQRFPGSKFILTTRKNSEAWFRSLKKHADRT